MKKTQEILGLPIISISDGMEVGAVKSIIVNADKGAVDYIVVDSGIQILNTKIIATDKILGIGEHAVTIEADNAIVDIDKIPAAIDLLQKNIQIKGTRVMTKKGRFVGETGDIFVDEDNCCSISGIEHINNTAQNGIKIIPRESVITFGKTLLVVKDNVETVLLDSVEQLSQSAGADEDEKKNLTNLAIDTPISIKEDESINLKEEFTNKYEDLSTNDTGAPEMEFDLSEATLEEKQSEIEEADLQQEPVVNIVEDTVEEFEEVEESTQETNEDTVEEVIGYADIAATVINELEEPAQIVEEVNETESVAAQDNSAASLFEQKQRQYLKGRKATKTIYDNQGNTIVSEGMVINDELIDLAKNSGKLIELVMNNKA